MNIVQEIEKAITGFASHTPEILSDAIKAMPALAAQVGGIVFSVAAGQEARTPGVRLPLGGHHGTLALIWTPDPPIAVPAHE